MNFDIPTEHRMIRDIVREFCEEKITPIAQGIEDKHRSPAEVFDQLTELDVMGIPVDEAYDGFNGDQLMHALVVEELGRVLGGISLSYAAHASLVSKSIELSGTDEQKEHWFTPLATGEHLGGWVLTESGSGSDASDMDTVTERSGDGYVIGGTKQFIASTNVAGLVLVRAITDPDASCGGISTFIVDPENSDGFEVTTEWDKTRLSSSPTYELSFDNCQMPEDHLLGEESGGWKQIMKTLDGGRISIVAFSVELAEGVYGHTKSYTQEHEQSDRLISKFNAVRDKLVLMYRKTERARLLTHKAATRYDAGKWVSRESTLAKLDTSETAYEVAEDAVQVLGGYGYTADFVPQQFYCNAKLVEIGEGMSEI